MMNKMMFKVVAEGIHCPNDVLRLCESLYIRKVIGPIFALRLEGGGPDQLSVLESQSP